jgi:hypothetical protein
VSAPLLASPLFENLGCAVWLWHFRLFNLR